jgi:aromatic ring-opening dioxygenase LigB subunit
MIRFACIAPHGGDILEELAADADTMRTTREAMTALGELAAAHRPETVVIMTPHGYHVPGMISVCVTQRCAGELEGAAGSVSVDAEVDAALAVRIGNAVQEAGAKVAWLGVDEHGNRAAEMEMDWGTLIPYWYLGARWKQPPQVVVLCPCPTLSPEVLAAAGAQIRKAAEEIGRRTVLVASADQGHGHHPDGPYGYTPESAAHDAAYTAMIRENALHRLLDWDPDVPEKALTDSYPQTVILHGALGGAAAGARLLSYEAPTYFGMAVAAFDVPWNLPD